MLVCILLLLSIFLLVLIFQLHSLQPLLAEAIKELASIRLKNCDNQSWFFKNYWNDKYDNLQNRRFELETINHRSVNKNQLQDIQKKKNNKKKGKYVARQETEQNKENLQSEESLSLNPWLLSNHNDTMTTVWVFSNFSEMIRKEDKHDIGIILFEGGYQILLSLYPSQSFLW